MWSEGRGGGLRRRPASRMTAAANEASSRTLRRFRRTMNAAAKAALTSMISSESPYTPVTVAMRVSGMLSTCAMPRRSQGNPVMR